VALDGLVELDAMLGELVNGLEEPDAALGESAEALDGDVDELSDNLS